MGFRRLRCGFVLTSGNISNGFVDVTTAALAQGTYNFNAKITDIAGNTSGASSNYTVTITTGADTTPPTVSSVVASGAGITNGNGDLNAGKVVTLTVAFSEAVTVNTSGGTPTLALNDGGAATYTGGSGSDSLIFSYTVAAGQNTSDLTVTAFNLNGATVRDAAGDDANLAGAVTNPSGRSEEHTSELQSHLNLECPLLLVQKNEAHPNPRSTHTPPPPLPPCLT